MGLSPINCWKVVTACVQSVVIFGAELWWKGDQPQSTIGRASDLQLLINWEARAITGCFRTTNLGALATESGLRSGRPAGEQAVAVRAGATQPSAGRPGQGCRGHGIGHRSALSATQVGRKARSY
jgi:hypothetical protein